MNEFLSVLRLKDKIVIVALMSVFALLLAGTAGAVAMVATNDSGINGGINNGTNNGNGTENGDTHTHTYTYHVEKNDIGEFYFVGDCTVENCQNPKITYIIEDGISEEIKTEPTCHSFGEKVYYFTPVAPFEEIEYTYTEQIPLVDHTYVGEIVADGDTVSVNASCAVEGCSGASVSVSGVADLEFVSSDAATCNTPRRDNYTFTSGGQTYNVAVLVEEEGPHTLNGKPVTDYQLPSGKYLYGTPGITTIVPLVSCGQWTEGCFICEGCAETIAIEVGTIPHSYEYSSDKITKYPDFTQNGEVELKCTNEGCTHVEKIVLPKAVENDNTVSLSIDEDNGKQTWKYSCTPDKYEFTVEFEFVTDWEHDHLYVYSSVTKEPTIYRDGEFVVKCTLCEKEKKHSIPKATADNADEIIEATEQNAKTYVYTYVSETYGFTEVFRVTEGNPLSHDYKYDLIPYNGGFAMKGTCEQPGCQETSIIREEGLVPNYENIAPTCTKPGYESFSYTYSVTGQTYYWGFETPIDESNHTFVCDEANTVYPSFESTGTSVLKCTGEGCTAKTESVTLPIAVVGDNALVDEESRTVIYTFAFTYNDIEFVVVAEYPLSEEHTHSYTYELIPKEGILGKFDFVGSCTYPLCTAKITDVDVPAVLEEDNSTCTGGIKQVWSYDHDGTVYYCYLDIWVPDGHHMDYVTNSPTTVNPTLDESGSMEIFCTKCGETYILELPPINDPAVIAEITKDTERQTSYSYIYHYVYNELDPDGFLDIELIILINK